MGELNLNELDLYELLDVEITSSTNDIKKAYRKKALQCHPDKNPDNPNAAKEFHRLSQILEILTDSAARLAYDRVLRGRKEAALRHRELDSKRRKLKEDLEAKERVASGNYLSKTADQLLKAEIERLRKEGSKQVEEEVQFVLNKIKEELTPPSKWDGSQYRIKIKWNVPKNDETNGGYTQEMLHRFLSKYGDITVLVMSPKKKGSALVEFNARNAAEMAVDLEVGLQSNPIKLEWVNGPPSRRNVLQRQGTLVKETDFESITLTKMRQAEERKRLIEQMKAEDDDT